MIQGNGINEERRNVYSLDLGELEKGVDIEEIVEVSDKVIKVSSSCTCTAANVEGGKVSIKLKTRTTGRFSPRVAITTEKGHTVYLNIKYKVI